MLNRPRPLKTGRTRPIGTKTLHSFLEGISALHQRRLRPWHHVSGSGGQQEVGTINRATPPALVALLAAGGLLTAACGGTGGTPATADTVHQASGIANPPAPPTVFPLTGLPTSGAADSTRPGLAVKIDNVVGSFPQAGLDQADLVFDTLVEGGLTRLFAVFQSQDAPLVGPIRSARPVDASLLKLLSPSCGLFAYSGAAQGEIAPTKDDCPSSTLISPDVGINGPFQMLHSRPSPHQVFASTSSLYGAGHSDGASWTPPSQVFTYSAAAEGGTAAPAASVYMDMSNFSSAAWTWSSSSGTWLRSQNGGADITTTGHQVSATNVVVLSVPIGHTGIFDAAHNEDPLVIVTGSATAWVLRDGHVIQGTWNRPDNSSPLQLSGTGGTITLQPGVTWVELLPQPNLPRITP